MENNQTIELLRVDLSLTKKDFSIELGITQNAYTNYIQGKRSLPTDLLIKIQNLYKVNINWLLTGKGEMYLEEPKETKKADGISINGANNHTVVNGSGNISINIAKSDFKDDSAEVEELISLLKYAPKSFIVKIIEKLRVFKELSQI